MDRKISTQTLKALREDAWLAKDWAGYTRAVKQLNRRFGKDVFDGGWEVVESSDPFVRHYLRQTGPSRPE